MAQKENTLTDSLAAAQRRLTVTASTNPIGLSESLTRTQQPNEPVDLNAEIIAEIEALSGALQTFDATSGKPNPELIDAAREVNELQMRLNEATHKLEQIKTLGTPLDRLHRATVAAEHRLTNFISAYTRIVTADLLVERFGQEVPI